MPDVDVVGDRDPYDVLSEDAFDYYAVMGAIIHFRFEDRNDKSVQLGYQVEEDQVRRRRDGAIKVGLGSSDGRHRIAFYQHGSIKWTLPDNEILTPDFVRVVVPPLDSGEPEVESDV